MKFLYRIFRYLTGFCISLALFLLAYVAFIYSVRFFIPDFSITSVMAKISIKVVGILSGFYLMGYVDKLIFGPKK